MDHEYCKQHPRPMPAPVMAAIRVRREPKMGDLGVTLRASPRVARAAASLLLITRIDCGDHNKTPGDPCRFRRRAAPRDEAAPLDFIPMMDYIHIIPPS